MRVGDLDIELVPHGKTLMLKIRLGIQEFATCVTEDQVRALGWSLVREADTLHTGGRNHVEI